MIYVLFGHSAAGKTTLLKKLSKMYYIDMNIKATNRASRGDDDDVVTFKTVEDFPEEYYDRSLIYSHGFEKVAGGRIFYGVNSLQIDEALSNGVPHWIICSSIDVDSKLMVRYYPFVVLVYLAADIPKSRIVSNLLSRRFSERENLQKRIESISAREADYSNNMYLFDYRLTNHFQTEKASIDAEMHRLSLECIRIMQKHGD